MLGNLFSFTEKDDFYRESRQDDATAIGIPDDEALVALAQSAGGRLAPCIPKAFDRDAEVLLQAYPEASSWIALCPEHAQNGAVLARIVQEAGSAHPGLHFLAMGSIDDYTTEILRSPNVVCPRTLGTTFCHEVALVRRANLCVGSRKSGLMWAALLSGRPSVLEIHGDEGTADGDALMGSLGAAIGSMERKTPSLTPFTLALGTGGALHGDEASTCSLSRLEFTRSRRDQENAILALPLLENTVHALAQSGSTADADGVLSSLYARFSESMHRSPTFHLARGLSKLRRGEPAASRRLALVALALDPEFKPARQLLALAQRLLPAGHDDRARDLEEALESARFELSVGNVPAAKLHLRDALLLTITGNLQPRDLFSSKFRY
jgi:hypothetical protein